VIRAPADGRLALFADCLIVGVCTAVAAIPLLTAYPAFVAGCAVLHDRIVEDRAVGLRGYVRRLGEVLASGPAGVLVPSALCGVLALDAIALAAGAPGRLPLSVLLVLAGAGGVLLGLRVAARWRPGGRWTAVVSAAAGRAVADPGGSALLVLAGGAAAAIALAVPITVLLVCGPLALAAVAVDLRPGTTRD
jgi:hypothetical protein